MTTLAEIAQTGKPLPLKGIVDMHAHLGEWIEMPVYGAGADTLVYQMDRVGVERTIVAHVSCVSADPVFGNNEVLKAMKAYPGRIEGYATVFPVSDKLGVDEVKRCIDAAAAGGRYILRPIGQVTDVAPGNFEAFVEAGRAYGRY